MLQLIKKNFFVYLIDLIISIVLIAISIEAFLVYALFILVLKIDTATNYLRALTRTYEFITEGKIGIIMKKLKISDSEVQNFVNEIEENMPQEAQDSLDRDLKLVQNN